MTRILKLAGLAILAIAGIAVLALLGDGQRASLSPAGPERFRSATGPVPSTPQQTGDPVAGRRALLNAPYVSCGMPYSAYRRLNPDTAPDLLIAGREGRNGELPFYLTSHVNDAGVEIISSNCLACHGGRINGELILGLGSALADFTRDPSRLALQAGTYVRGPAETEAWQQWADRIDGIAPYVRTRTVGANPAPNVTWALMAHLDPKTLKWSEKPLIDPPPEDPLPISVPPWWNVRKKNALFYTTIGRGDQTRFMLLASMLCINGTSEVDRILSYAPDIRAFIASLEAPPFPGQIDERLASEGEVVFDRYCSACHGTYGAAETYPNVVVPVEEVGTDAAYASESTDGSRDRFFAWVASSPYGDPRSAAPARGYIAPPLDGVWATAPYLHNGSVPSMAALLFSDLRPRYWRHRSDPPRYDPDTMSWEFEALTSGQDAEPDPESRRQIYDTTLRGYGKDGHTYSDKLSERARAALLEYLKTL